MMAGMLLWAPEIDHHYRNLLEMCKFHCHIDMTCYGMKKKKTNDFWLRTLSLNTSFSKLYICNAMDVKYNAEFLQDDKLFQKIYPFTGWSLITAKLECSSKEYGWYETAQFCIQCCETLHLMNKDGQSRNYQKVCYRLMTID